MNKKILIEKITKEQEKDNIIVIFKLDVNKKKYLLKYNLKYIDCEMINPTIDRCDTVVTSMLLFAMIYGYDFESKYYISEKLFYNLTYHIIPQLKLCNKDLYEVKINIPTTAKVFLGKNVATGISCGIDSLTTIYEYSKLCNLNSYKLTHLVYFKTGAHDGQIGKFDEKLENDLFNSQLKNAVSFCKKNNYPLIVVDSNLNKILFELFGFTSYDRTHTLRSCGTMMLFQNDFNKYYYAATYGLDKFFININEDIAHYEKYLLPLLSNDSINFYSANKGMSRFEKTKLLVDYKESYDNLLVCWHEGSNCCKCDKCVRTLVTLDILNRLNDYKDSFDIPLYLKNRKKYISKVIAMRNVDPFFYDIYIHMTKKIKKQKSLLFLFVYKIKAIFKYIKKILKKNRIIYVLYNNSKK